MNASFRWFATLALCVLALSACNPSSSPQSASATGKPASASTVTLQPSFSGQYDILSVAQATEPGNKIEVLEFFGYFCSHCKSFDPGLTAWAQKNRGKIVFKRVPVAFRDNIIAQQRMYFALEAMNKLEPLHAQIFRAVQEERLPLSNETEISAYLAKHGVDTVKFKEAFHSPAVQAKASQAAALQSAYLVNSVPLIAIDGRYITSGTHALKRPGIEMTESGVQNAILSIMDELVAKSAAERSAPK